MEGEHAAALGQRGPRPLDPPDAAVAVAEGEAERAAQRPDRLVERPGGVDLPAVGQHLGPAADARPLRAYEDFALVGDGQVDRHQRHPAGRREGDRGRGRVAVSGARRHGHLSCSLMPEPVTPDGPGLLRELASVPLPTLAGRVRRPCVRVGVRPRLPRTRPRRGGRWGGCPHPGALGVPDGGRAPVAALRVRHPAPACAAGHQRRRSGRAGLRHRPRGARDRPRRQAARRTSSRTTAPTPSTPTSPSG